MKYSPTKIIILSTFILLFLVTSCLSMPIYEGVTSKTIFKAGDDKYKGYRIPSIISVNNKLLAFAEGRVNGFSDTGNIDIVMKSSLDNGKSWSNLSLIWDDEQNTCGNPTPVVIQNEDGSTRILMVGTWNDGKDHESEIIKQISKSGRKIYTFYSDDLGKTWSTPMEITDSVKKESWTWYATGPGVGIVLKKGKNAGRIIIPCDHIDSETSQYHSHLIYSDDLGTTWSIGAIAAKGTNECQIIEKESGELIVNMRRVSNVHSKPYRLISKSDDSGESFKDLTSEEDEQLISPVCQAAFIKTDNRVYFSNPASENRKKMSVKVSYDEGDYWSKKILLWKDASAYSSLAVNNYGQLFCLYECGKIFPYEEIRIAIIDESILSNDGIEEILPFGVKREN